MKEQREIEENHLAQKLPAHEHFCYDRKSPINNENKKNNTS